MGEVHVCVHGAVCVYRKACQHHTDKALNSVHGESGLWVPEKGIFWECDSSTEDSDEESTNDGSSDCSGSDNS